MHTTPNPDGRFTETKPVMAIARINWGAWLISGLFWLALYWWVIE